jgi:hypothetical protein
MNCPQCQAQNPADAKFCGSCGATLSNTPSPGPGPLPPPKPAGEPVSQGLKVGIIIGSLFVPILGIVMGLVYLNDTNPEKKAVGKLWLIVGAGALVLGCVCYGIMAVAASSGGGGF